MNFKKGDRVRVISGSNKGKEGTITQILKEENKIVIEGVNMVKKHVKPNGQNEGSIVDREAPIHASNAMIVEPKSGKTSRIGHEVDKNGKKVRVTKKSNEKLS
ncbi:50S ribosomal protein L24 [Firmicutes bacterium CAG:884]|jgi:large subunit ribosomal protein L24|nr:50S ribosomal protein L24 [Firmicutes bacterium CAG:884]